MEKKKWTALLLIGCMCLSLGCGASEKTKDMTAGEQESTAAADAEKKDASQEYPGVLEDADGENGASAPQVNITSGQNLEWYSEDGSQWPVHCEYMEVSVSGQGYEKAAESVRRWSEEKVAQLQAQGDEYAQWAAEDEAIAEYFADSYFYSMFNEIQVARADSQVISLLEMYSDYTGGAHGNYGFIGTTFDAVSGEILELEDILKDDDGFRARAADAIKKELEEKYGEELFPDYADTVEKMWSVDGGPKWYLNGAGITFIFNPYEVGPYAMGEVRIMLPYLEFAEYMEASYVGLNGAGTAQIPMEEEVMLSELSAPDGQKELLRVHQETLEDYMDGPLYLELNGSATEVGTFGSVGDVYLLRREDGRTFVILDADYASADFVTFVYEAADGKLVLRDRMEGAGLQGGAVNTQSLVLNKHLDVLGTYIARMDYTMDENGKLVQEDEFFQIQQRSDPYCLLTTAQELPVTIEGADTVLPAGSRIRIVSTDDIGTAVFRDEDSGEEGEIHYVRGDGAEDTWTIYIDGVPDYEYFELLPYAG